MTENNSIMFMKYFISGGLGLVLSIYLIQKLDPLVSGLLIAIPFGIVLAIFINQQTKLQTYVITHTISIMILALVTLVFHYLYIIKGVNINKSILITILLWLGLIGIIWSTDLHHNIIKTILTKYSN